MLNLDRVNRLSLIPAGTSAEKKKIRDAATKIAKKRVALAGVRLAKILNEELK